MVDRKSFESAFKDKDCNEMSYKKCKECEYCKEYYILSEGVFWTCIITGKSYLLKECVKCV